MPQDHQEAAGPSHMQYLAIVWGFGVNIHSGQVVRLLDAGVPVDAGQVDNLFPGTFHGVQGSCVSWAARSAFCHVGSEVRSRKECNNQVKTK